MRSRFIIILLVILATALWGCAAKILNQTRMGRAFLFHKRMLLWKGCSLHFTLFLITVYTRNYWRTWKSYSFPEWIPEMLQASLPFLYTIC